MTPPPVPAAPPPPDATACAGRHPQAVARALAAQPAPAQVERAAALLKVVADPTRLRLLSALNAAGPGGELCVCDLAAVIDLSESAVSHQLRLLRQVRAVQTRREGRVVYYRLLDAHLTDLIGSALDHAAEQDR
ncbi:ArsR/SmtB family transcription factor [Deinococcus depolymerans]|uniref:Metalloregulator ArsR/SmtB family transcription factor n=1 Tax=Deinococcus depolymerans TaxID=392408 RepID=A0ABN1BP94_9DEIO